jgi:hypothetical protein
MKKLSSLITFAILLCTLQSNAQIDEDKLGAWYMYFWNTTIQDGPWGFQGDIQYRNWDTIGDLEQLLLRGGLTYKPEGKRTKFTLGYGNVSTGEFGSGTSTVHESRIYQEALIPHKLGILYLTHRLRYEQRFVESQDFRTRYRYNFFVNIPLTNGEITEKSLYLALYNELFINGEKDIGDGRTVKKFDRNRTYISLGYAIKSSLKVQAGFMRQFTNNWTKNQLQLSLHHSF